MRAILFENKLVYKEDYPAPQPSGQDALVRVLQAGICHTDLEITKGYMGFQGIPGHEFVGIVEKSNQPEWVGKRVVGEINAACGECSYCRKGLDRHCPNRSVLGIQNRDGAFADYLVLPESNLFQIAENISDDVAVFTEPIAAAVEIVEQVDPKPGTPVLVIGDGKLGLLGVLVLRAYGMEISLVGKHPERAGRVIKEEIPFYQAEDKIDKKFPVVVEATGRPEGFARAQQQIEPRGTLVLKTTIAENPQANLAQLVIDEITVVGSRCGPFGPAIKLLKSGKVDPTPLIEQRFPIEEGLSAFERAKRSGGKVLIQMK